MSFETVYHDTVPYDLTLRLVMGDAARALVMRHNRLTAEDRDIAQIRQASEMLSPNQPDKDEMSYYSREQREYRLIERAREAMSVPITETEENVRLLLGRASMTLENLAKGEVETTAEIDFVEKVVDGMREVAAMRRAQPTDIVQF